MFEGWAILELMGHRRLAGIVSEETLAGAAFLRIDVPSADGSPPATQWYSAAAVYALTPTTEETARAFAANNRPMPIQRWELPALPGRRSEPDADPFDEEDGPEGAEE